MGTFDGTNTTFLLTDALGSVVSSFNRATGNSILGNQGYGPYGKQRYTAGSIDSTTAKGFTGQYNDNQTGLDYYGARYYDPAAGRFLSADSVQGNAQGMDPYAYVGGNPETRSDPSGRRYIQSGNGGGTGASSTPPSSPPIDNWWNDPPTVPLPYLGPSVGTVPGMFSKPSSVPAVIPFNTKPVDLSTTSPCGASVLLCGNYGGYAALYTSMGQIGVPTNICLICVGSEGGSGDGGGSRGNSDITYASDATPSYNEALLDDPYLSQESEAQLTTYHPDVKSAFTKTIDSLERIGGPLGDDLTATQDRGLNNNANGVGGLDNGMRSGTRRWRLDYDPGKGVHFNFESWMYGKGKFGRKGAAIISGYTLQDFQEMILLYNDFGVDGMLGYQKQ